MTENHPTQMQVDVDALAQEIRRVDGKHDMGAGALAEALMPFLSSRATRAQAQNDEADDAAGQWRRLALQFDDHRMQALGWLKSTVDDLPERAASPIREFLKAPPLSGEQVLANRVAAMVAQSAAKVGHIDGDLLPPVGTEVLIHLASIDKWVCDTVIGYYVWGDLGGDASLQRVFVRVKDRDGYQNARLLRDVRKRDGTPYILDRKRTTAASEPVTVASETIAKAYELGKEYGMYFDSDWPNEQSHAADAKSEFQELFDRHKKIAQPVVIDADNEEKLLPAEFRSGNCIPVSRSTIKRERMVEIIGDVSQAIFPDDAVALLTSEVARLGMLVEQLEAEKDRTARERVRPAASAEPCKTCSGAGGWERETSSTSGLWVKCPDCTAAIAAKPEQP